MTATAPHIPSATLRGRMLKFAERLTTPLVPADYFDGIDPRCGHFPEGIETFAKTSIEGETGGQWYLRQMLGSANISGSQAMHFMTGNLSYQIEHHLFPDLPSNGYQQIAPKVREFFERYKLTYTTGRLPKQIASASTKVIRLSLLNDFLAKATKHSNENRRLSVVSK